MCHLYGYKQSGFVLLTVEYISENITIASLNFSDKKRPHSSVTKKQQFCKFAQENSGLYLEGVLISLNSGTPE